MELLRAKEKAPRLIRVKDALPNSSPPAGRKGSADYDARQTGEYLPHPLERFIQVDFGGHSGFFAGIFSHSNGMTPTRYAASAARVYQ